MAGRSRFGRCCGINYCATSSTTEGNWCSFAAWQEGHHPVCTDRTGSHTLTVSQSVDPSCSIGPRGIGYVASIHDSLPGGDSHLLVQRSLDGGHTWSQAAVPVDSRSLDRAYVTPGTQSRAGKGL